MQNMTKRRYFSLIFANFVGVTLQQMLIRLKNYQEEHPYIAYAYVILSTASFAFMFTCQKINSQEIDPLYAIYIRALFLTLINTITLNAQGISASQFQPNVHTILIKRSIVNGFTFILLSIGLQYLSLSVSMSIYNLSPIFVHFMQAFMFGKTISKIHFFFTVGCFIGVLLIVKPDFLFNQGDGLNYFIVFPLISAFLVSLASIYLYQVKGKASNLIFLHYFYIAQGFLAGLVQIGKGSQLQFSEITQSIFLSLIGLIGFSYVAQFFNTRALMIKPPSLVMPFNYLTVIISLAIDTWIFEIHFDVYSLIGIMLTSSGLLIKLIIKQ